MEKKYRVTIHNMDPKLLCALILSGKCQVHQMRKTENEFLGSYIVASERYAPDIDITYYSRRIRFPGIDHPDPSTYLWAIGEMLAERVDTTEGGLSGLGIKTLPDTDLYPYATEARYIETCAEIKTGPIIPREYDHFGGYDQDTVDDWIPV